MSSYSIMSFKHFLLFPFRPSLFMPFSQLRVLSLGEGRREKGEEGQYDRVLLSINVTLRSCNWPAYSLPIITSKFRKGAQGGFQESILHLLFHKMPADPVSQFWGGWCLLMKKWILSKIVKGDSTEVIHSTSGCDTLSSGDLKGLEPGKRSIVAT